MTVENGRAFNEYFPVPLMPDAGESKTFSEPARPPLLWRILGLAASDPEVGMPLFPGNAGSRRRAWDEFKNYIRQAEENFEAAEHTSGTSAALTYYYSFLNLAKAELLRTDPGRVIGTRIHHGLSLNPSSARSVARDRVKVVETGVFPLLYEARVGRKLPETSLPIGRVVSNIPEVGWELEVAGLGTPLSVDVRHAVAVSNGEAWSVIALSDRDRVEGSDVTSRLLRTHFREIRRPRLWRELFAFRRGVLPIRIGFYESIQSETFSPGDNRGELEAMVRASPRSWNRIGDIVDYSTSPGSETILCPSIYRTRMTPMLASLARFVLMFYASSLVRYRPALLDPRLEGSHAWFLDALIEQTAVPFLQDATNWILGTRHYYENV